jgi:ABC-type antimicrobial peptide transport system permease subunit
VVGAFIGALLGFLIILGWAGTLIYDQPLPGANGASVFFGSLFFCTVLGISGGILTDLLIARRNRRDYLRATAQEHNG